MTTESNRLDQRVQLVETEEVEGEVEGEEGEGEEETKPEDYDDSWLPPKKRRAIKTPP